MADTKKNDSAHILNIRNDLCKCLWKIFRQGLFSNVSYIARACFTDFTEK